MPESFPASLVLPYLTLSAHPAIGTVLLDPRPAWVWNGEGNRILWANGAGLAFFGETSMDALLDRRFGDVHPARRHLARLARNARADVPMLDRMRFFITDQTVTVTCLCKRLDVAGETVLLLIGTDQEAFGQTDQDRARSVLAALCQGPEADRDYEIYSAQLLDNDGQVIAQSGQSAGAHNDRSLLDKMALMSQGSRDPVSDVLRLDGKAVRRSVAPIGDNGVNRFLALFHAPQSKDESDSYAMLMAELSDNGEPDGDGAALDADMAEADIFGIGGEAPSLNIPYPFNEADKLRDRDWQPFMADDGQGVGADQSQTSMDSDKISPFGEGRGSFHFVWESDEAGRFSYVSEDFASAVGAGHADIVGKSWTEIARKLDLDDDSSVAQAFDSQDTWSGLTVLWPVEKQPIRIPVELTGLPVYGRYHGFQGFRGFGICHIGKARHDGTSQTHTPEKSSAGAFVALPQFHDNDPLMSETLMDVAREAVVATEELVSEKEDNRAVTRDEDPSLHQEPSDAPEQVEPQEETEDAAVAFVDDTGEFGGSFVCARHDETGGEADEPSRPALPEDPYKRVSLLLSGSQLGVTERAGSERSTPEPNAEQGQSADPELLMTIAETDDASALSAGERTAFDEIAATLGKEPFESRLPTEDIDDDYAEFEASQFDIADMDDEDEDGDKAVEEAELSDADVDADRATPAGDQRPDMGSANSPEPSPAKLAETEKTEERLPAGEPNSEGDQAQGGVQTSLQKALQSRLTHDKTLRSAASIAFRDILAMDPSFRHMRTRLAELGRSDDSRRRDEGEEDKPAEPEMVEPGPEEVLTEETGIEEQAPFIADDSPLPDAAHEQDTDAVDGSSLNASETVAEIEAIDAIDATAEAEDEASRTETAQALTVATVAGVAALGGEDIWDREATSSPLIDLLNKLPTAIIVSAKSEILFASKKALRALGFEKREELDALGGMEGLFSGRPGDWLTKTDGRTNLRGADGAPVSVLASIASINWGERPAAMLCFEKSPETQPALGVSEEDEKIAELEAILDTATDGVIVLNEDGHILRMNHSAEALFEVDRHNVAGGSVLNLLAEESHKVMLDYLASLKANDLASILNTGREVVGTVASGGQIPLTMTMGRIAIPGTRRFCAVLRDMSEWRNAQEQLLAEKQKAELASEQKSAFLAKVSHEIRTPLNAIIGFSEVMVEERFGTIGTERYKDYLNDIRVSGKHIMSLINDLLDLSKVEAGKLTLDVQPTDINALVQESVGLMQPQSTSDQIIVRTSLGSNLPRIAADERSLRQIILNLLSNGLKFTPSGGQIIISTLLEDDGAVKLRIRDTGVGMSEEEIKDAFEPFRQIAPTRNTETGTGLGLPLTKALVEINKARLNITSEKNHGTLVEVHFPKDRIVVEPDRETVT